MGEPFEGSIGAADVEKFTTDNGYIEESARYTKFKGYECSVLKSVGPMALMTKAIRLPNEPDDGEDDEEADARRHERLCEDAELAVMAEEAAEEEDRCYRASSRPD